MSEFNLNAEARSDIGKGASRRLRREADMIPGVVYGGKTEAQSITLAHNAIVHMLEDEASYSSIINLIIDGNTEEVILKDLQRHPFKPKIIHVDFKRVVRGEIMHATVPLHFINESKAPGVKEGGVVSHHVNSVEVSCLPRHLPEFIEVDLSGLETGGVVHLSDIALPEGVTLDALAQGEDHDLAVANIIRAGGPSAEASEEASEE